MFYVKKECVVKNKFFIFFLAAIIFSSCCILDKTGEHYYVPSESVEIKAVNGSVQIDGMLKKNPKSDLVYNRDVMTDDKLDISYVPIQYVHNGETHEIKLDQGSFLSLTVTAISLNNEPTDTKIYVTYQGKTTEYSFEPPLNSRVLTFKYYFK